jgi:hypothetical protein
MRIGLALLMALVISTPAFAQADAPRLSVNALVGPSFGNVGTTFSTTGEIQYRLNDWIAVGGQGGMMPHGPFRKADEIAPAAPAVDFGPVAGTPSTHVDAYHWNGNVTLRPAPIGRFGPYVTGGFGGFMASTVMTHRFQGGARSDAYSRSTHPATNVGTGAMYRATDWLGLGADYRTFFVHRDGDTPKVHRFTAGISVFLE